MSILFANNALSTLAGAISNVATSATLAPGTGSLFPNPTGSDYFLLTFTDAATGLVNEIVKVTARSGDVLTIVRAQEGTAAAAWNAGDNASALITAGALDAFEQTANLPVVRTRLTGDVTYFVSATGNDSTGDGSSGNPWLTIQHAINVVSVTLDLGGFVVTISVGAGTFAGFSILAPFIGANGPGSFVINGASASTTLLSSGVVVANAAVCTINSLQFAGGGANSLLVSSFSTVYLATGNPVAFPANAGGIHIDASNNGNVTINGNYNVTGGANAHLNATGQSNVIFLTGTCTLSGTPAFSSAFASASVGSVIQAGTPASYSGTATGLRYSVALNSVINTNGGGANYFPGSIAGSTATGGQYA